VPKNDYTPATRQDEWQTPPDLYRKLNDEFHFTIDAAATGSNALCVQFFSKENSAFDQGWWGPVWAFCNPPYARYVQPNLEKWIELFYRQSQMGTGVVALIPATPETKAWWKYIHGKAEIRWIEGRLKYVDPATGTVPKSGAKFASAIVIWHPKPIDQCHWCRRTFVPNRRGHRFCSGACRQARYRATFPRPDIEGIA
jgi:phage N-6-adenine-methyltransferase